jgi:hypothetical protein
MRKVVIVFSVLLGLATMAQAQFSQFHFGLGFPSGKFSDGDGLSDILNRGEGMAAMGFTAGYKHYSPLAAENLSWVFGLDVFYNGLNTDAKDYIEDMGFDDVVFPVYLNIPATIGLNYAIPLQEGIKLYGEAAVGANYSIPTKLDLSDRSGYQDMTYEFTPAFGLTYGLEGGLFINDKYTVGLRYNKLGSYKFKYEIDYEENDTLKEKFGKALPITNISLSVGVLF